MTLTNVNETPVAVVDTATAVEAGGTANGTAGTNPTGNVLTNDTDIDAGDTMTVSGVVAGTSASASGSVGTGVAGTFGTISIAANGAYNYTIDNSNIAVQALRTSANTLADVFTYTMRDTDGLTSTTQITVTIQGANDTPVATSATMTLNEGQTVTFSGSDFGITDPDDTSFTYTITSVGGGYFQLTSAAGTAITTFASADLSAGLVQLSQTAMSWSQFQCASERRNRQLKYAGGHDRLHSRH